MAILLATRWARRREMIPCPPLGESGAWTPSALAARRTVATAALVLAERPDGHIPDEGHKGEVLHKSTVAKRFTPTFKWCIWMTAGLTPGTPIEPKWRSTSGTTPTTWNGEPQRVACG